MWNLPPGFMSAMCGTLAAMRLKSSRSSSTPASLAMASRCSTALVEPPSAEVTAMAFSNASLVMIWRGVMPSRSRLTTASPARSASPSRRRSTAGGDAVPGRRHADRLGDRAHRVGREHAAAGALAGARVALDLAEFVLGDRAGRAGADRLEHAGDVERLAVVVARHDRAVVDEHAGRSRRAAAISIPGMLLSQPARPTKPSNRSACITVSTESAMTSRLTPARRACPRGPSRCRR